MSPSPGFPASGEADRPIGPPGRTYDAAWVASSARTADPGLPEEVARELAVHAWEHLREVGELDAPEVARRLLVEHPATGATAANVVAKAAVDFCAAHEVRP